MGKHGARAQPDAIYVYVLHVLEVFKGQFVDGAAYVNARIAYQYVYAAELFESPGDHSFNFVFLCYVCLETDGFDLMIRGDLFSARANLLEVAAGQKEVGPC